MSEPRAGSGTEHLDPAVMEAYLARTRWFGGKGRPLRVSGVRRLGVVPGGVAGGPTVLLHLVEVTYDDVAPGPDAVETYQVPLSCYTDPERRLDHAFVGWWEEPDLGWVHAYDALHDKHAMACWLRSFVAAREQAVGDPATGLSFVRLPGHELDPDAVATLFTGEQSNSSVRFGEDAVLKVFRKITPGANPDIEIHDELTRAGSTQVAALYGWVELGGDAGGPPTHLAMLQQLLTTATDGFDLALSSVRNLFGEGDLHAHEVGGDFAGEATRLGEALAEVHTALRERFPTATTDTTRVAAAMRARLAAAVDVVPELAAHAPALESLYADLAALGPVETQRVHGDLHLGQTLRTSAGWKVVDFEGEPAKTLAERVLPDSRWRDVAGMLRSFDYAPHVVERTLAETDAGVATQHAVRAEEWSQRNRNHFLVAYAGGALSDEEGTLLAAYTADKAVYECVYETRNRPTWVAIPLAAVARIGAR